jgi:choline dehydrogenase
MDAAFDTVVVGAGSAGAALAARLSEDPAHHVLLVEAGPDLGPRNRLPAAILDARSPITTDYDWGYQSEPDHAGRSIPLPRAKLVGGCSATNAVFALRGSPGDYDHWAALGNNGWSFAGVLPFIRALETDLDFDDEWHGHDGPIAIQRVPVDGLREHQRAALEAAWTLGHPQVEDHNRPGAMGAGPLPRNAPGDERLSTALAYLAPAGTRPNLTVRADTLVDRANRTLHQCLSLELLGTKEPPATVWKLLKRDVNTEVTAIIGVNEPCVLRAFDIGSDDAEFECRGWKRSKEGK